MVRRPRPPRSSPPPTALYVVLGAVVVAGVLGFLLLGRSGREPAAAPRPGPEPVAPAAAPAPDPAEDARRWFDDQLFDHRGRRRELDGAALKALLSEAERRGVPGLPARAKDLYEAARKRDPLDPEANRFLGRVPLQDYPEFFEVFRKLADAKAVPADIARFRNEVEGRVDLRERRAPALDPVEFDRAKALLDAFVQFERRCREDPSFRVVFEERERLRLEPILGEYETVDFSCPPFVFFYGSRALSGEGAEAARERFRQRLAACRLLVEQHLAFFRERWVLPLGLPDFGPTDLLFVWVFDERETFDEYGKRIGQVAPPSVLGYFDPVSHRVFLYDPGEKEHASVEATLAHELTHQLHWWYANRAGGGLRKNFERSPAWFNEGWAEYVGAVAKDGDRYTFAGDQPGRLALFHFLRKEKLPLFPVRKLLDPPNYLEWMREVRTWAHNTWLKDRREQWPAYERAYFSMLYSEGWLLVKFLHDGAGGKRREGVERFTAETLRGYRGHGGSAGRAFAEVFGLRSEADWAAFEQEFHAFLDAQLQKHPPAGK